MHTLNVTRPMKVSIERERRFIKTFTTGRYR